MKDQQKIQKAVVDSAIVRMTIPAEVGFSISHGITSAETTQKLGHEACHFGWNHALQDECSSTTHSVEVDA